MKKLPWRCGALLVGGFLAASATAQNPGTGYGNGYYPRADDRATGYPDSQRDSRVGYEGPAGAYYDYARVVRVDPIIVDDSSSDPRCHERSQDGYVVDDRGFRNEGYRREEGYRDDEQRRVTESGRQWATILGGVAGAVLGSQIGGGDGRYLGSAVGGVLGGTVGRSIYEATTRDEGYRSGTVRVCEPLTPRRGDGYESERVDGYTVTYEYAGRTYQTRRDHHPGEQIRVRVDVSAD